METKRFDLKQEPENGWWKIIDTVSEISIRFKEHEFNDTQSVNVPDNFPADPQRIARIMQEMGDWLFLHHYSVIFHPGKYEMRFDEDSERIIIIRHAHPKFRIVFEDDCTLSKAIQKVKGAAAFMQSWQRRHTFGKEDN